LSLLAEGYAGNVAGADSRGHKDVHNSSQVISSVEFLVSIDNSNQAASEVQGAFEDLLLSGHVTVGFLLPSTNAPSHTIEGLRSDASIQSIKNAFQRMIQASARRESVRFVMSGLSIERGYLEISSGTSHMRFLADGSVQFESQSWDQVALLAVIGLGSLFSAFCADSRNLLHFLPDSRCWTVTALAALGSELVAELVCADRPAPCRFILATDYANRPPIGGRFA
jgi:hypothetical protein